MEEKLQQPDNDPSSGLFNIGKEFVGSRKNRASILTLCPLGLPLLLKVAACHFVTTIFLVKIPPTDDVSL